MRYFNNGFTAHPPLFVAWNQNDKSSNVNLSGGLLTAANVSTGDGGVRATLYRNTGKWYTELNVSVISGGDSGAGLANAVATFSALIANAAGGMIQFKSGNVYKNGSVVFGNGNMGGGGILRVAYDADAHLAWLAFAAGTWNNSAGTPDAGTNGQDTSAFDSGGLFPVALLTANGDTNIINPGSSSFTYALPAGFTAWNG